MNIFSKNTLKMLYILKKMCIIMHTINFVGDNYYETFEKTFGDGIGTYYVVRYDGLR